MEYILNEESFKSRKIKLVILTIFWLFEYFTSSVVRNELTRTAKYLTIGLDSRRVPTRLKRNIIQKDEVRAKEFVLMRGRDT